MKKIDFIISLIEKKTEICPSVKRPTDLES